MGHKKSTWEELCEKLEGTYFKGTFTKPEQVIFHYKNIEILLDSYMVLVGSAPITYTRIRSVFKNPKKVEFKLYHEGFFSQVGKLLGMQDILIEDNEFDQRFVVKGNDESIIKQILNDYELKQLLLLGKPISLEVKTKEKGLIRADESIISYQANGIIKDLDILENILNIFMRLADVMVEMGYSNEGQISSKIKG